ncbi:MAG: cysteine desulfurase [Clostridiales bacterium]|nr:cysteine desulfurase [Clostridiales bacterium]
MIYADYASTTPVDKEVVEQMYACLKNDFANASSVHLFGRETSYLIEKARKEIAQILNADKNEIYFTSGGTESDNWALQGVIEATGKKHIITTSIEHHAILNCCKFLEKKGIRVTYLSVDKYGKIDIDALKNAICEDTAIISIIAANNEIGTIQDIDEIGKIAKENNIIFHTDAVQAIGSLKIDVKKSNISLMSLSAHKFYGPKGIGILYIKSGTKISNMFYGGSQERDRRPGTSNTPLIVGMSVALRKLYENFDINNCILTKRSDTVKEIIKNNLPQAIFNGHPTQRINGNISISFPNIQSDALVVLLDAMGVAVSNGAACSAGSVKTSHVIKAINSDAEMFGTIRISLSHLTTEDEAINIANTVVNAVKNLLNK